MLKQTKYNIADSNIANLGTDLEKKVREAAAKNEPAWTNAGKEVGLLVWRIEKFNVKAWPKNQYGTFYSGDSYIVLNTYKKPGQDKLLHDVHFWLGTFTTQDEAGTAAYKTVELDDSLHGDPIEHREVQGYESDLFLSYFKNEIKILEGGIESGFNHVKPETYQPRLLHFKGKKKVRVTQVPLTRESLNAGDVFILDNGLTVYQWNGSQSGPGERMKAAQFARALDDERKGLPSIVVLEEKDKDEKFWSLLGGHGPVKSAEEGGSDLEEALNKASISDRRLLHLSDASGKMEFKEVAHGDAVNRGLLKSDDVFILDSGFEVFTWIGKGASGAERRTALDYASQYLQKYNRPLYLPITRILEGGENEVFEHSIIGKH